MIAKFLLEAGKRAALAGLAERATKLYTAVRHGGKKFFDRIGDYAVKRADGTQYTLGEMAAHHGLESYLEDSKQAMQQKFKDYLIRLNKFIGYIQNLGQIANHKLEDYKINVYVAARGAFDELSKLAGYTPKVKIGKYGYLTDFSTAYMDAIGDINKRLERLLSMGSALDSARLAYHGFSIALRNLEQKAIEKKRIISAGLEKIVSAPLDFDQARKATKPVFRMYGDLVREIKASYAADLDRGIYLARSPA
ncbi:hypothetical protein HYV80_06315 [Candidatus Woesearchaeota archaeon]|nr:hypothetical protein [Candidatus Woesearchaeota archaeon]